MKPGFIILLSSLLSACSSGVQPPPPANSGWTNYGKGGMTELLSNPFAFPAQSSGQVIGYVYTASPPLAQGKTITLTYEVAGNGVLGVADPADTPPASITLFIWEKGDDLSSTTPGYQYKRWWCPSRGDLSPGNHTLACTIDGHWTDVVGQSANGPDPNAAGGFAQALANPIGIGFTCGGQNFFGHGCWATSGSLTFKIDGLTIQ